MRLVKVSASNLMPGMFIAELDRPWLDTPFTLQGFMVRDDDEVLYISRYVDHVFVDVDYKGSVVHLSLMTEPTRPKRGSGLRLKADFQQAKVSFESAADTLNKVFESIHSSRSADVQAVKEAVNPLIEGVFRNQEAVAALLRLKEVGNYRYNHGISMAIWAVILGRHLGLHRQELEKLAVGCAMSDIGMTLLPANLIDQTHELTEDQLALVKSHPLGGAELVTKNKGADLEIVAIIENHHERMDGSGYPRQIEGAAIPLLARIAGLVDSYDAMITPRPYARVRTSHEAVHELIDGKGTLFQGVLVEQFIQAIGLFPTGTLVELNTGEVAIVVKQNDTRRLKPELVVVLDTEKNRLEQLVLIDLSNQDIGSKDDCWITSELTRGAYGVNSEEFFI